jgi:hypothetical protein
VKLTIELTPKQADDLETCAVGHCLAPEGLTRRESAMWEKIARAIRLARTRKPRRRQA